MSAFKTPRETHMSLGVGEAIVGTDPLIITTVLGSCVAVCIYSLRGTGGGMNHYLLPNKAASGSQVDDAFKYGDASTIAMIESILELPGIDIKDLRAKIMGGANIRGNGVVNANVGIQNVAVAKKVLKQYGIPLIGEDTGGAQGRKAVFYTESGRLRGGLLGEPKNAAQIAPPKITITEPPKKESTRAGLKKPRRVLIVDDSKTIRQMLRQILEKDPALEIVGEAEDPLVAEKFLARNQVDIMTLDIHMPNMDGVTFLKKIMEKKPMPVIMITAMGIEDGDEVLKALEYGAVDYIQKPKMSDMAESASLICEKVKAAAAARLRRGRLTAVQPAARKAVSQRNHGKTILAIGASTGGTEAIKEVLMGLPADIPPTVIVQHIPGTFSKAFANRLDQLCPFSVKEAENGDKLKSNQVLIAPGGFQMRLKPDGLGFKVAITNDEPVNRHKPSVDALFFSVAELVKGNAIGVILTGMGRDGADGLAAMRKAGSHTIGQDEATCVVYGMPKVAFEVGGVEKVLPLELVASNLAKLFEKK